MTVVLGDYPIVLLLVLFRITGIILPLPFFNIPTGSGWLLAGLALPVTLLFCSVLPASWVSSVAALQTPGALVFALLGEVLLGAGIGLICGIFISVFVVAGALAGQSASLSMAEDLDPITGESSDVLTQIWRMLFLLIILSLDAHLLIFRVIARTFEVLPVPWIGWFRCGHDIALLGATSIHAGAAIALPVMVVALLVSIGMGLISRLASGFDVLFLSIPIRLISAFLMIKLTLLFGGSTMRGMAYDMLTAVTKLLEV